MNKLSLCSVNDIDRLQAPEECRDITLESPALSIFTDFRYKRPYVIDVNTRAADAEHMMISAHVRMKIVVDTHEHFLGLIDVMDLAEENVIRVIASGLNHGAVLVKDLMIPKKHIRALSYAELENATVKNVLYALRQYGLQHCLVVDTDNHLVRGLISASDIVRKMHLPLSTTRPPTFAEICAAIPQCHEDRKHALQ